MPVESKMASFPDGSQSERREWVTSAKGDSPADARSHRLYSIQEEPGAGGRADGSEATADEEEEEAGSLSYKNRVLACWRYAKGKILAHKQRLIVTFSATAALIVFILILYTVFRTPSVHMRILFPDQSMQSYNRAVANDFSKKLTIALCEASRFCSLPRQIEIQGLDISDVDVGSSAAGPTDIPVLGTLQVSARLPMIVARDLQMQFEKLTINPSGDLAKFLETWSPFAMPSLSWAKSKAKLPPVETPCNGRRSCGECLSVFASKAPDAAAAETLNVSFRCGWNAEKSVCVSMGVPLVGGSARLQTDSILSPIQCNDDGGVASAAASATAAAEGGDRTGGEVLDIGLFPGSTLSFKDVVLWAAVPFSMAVGAGRCAERVKLLQDFKDNRHIRVFDSDGGARAVVLSGTREGVFEIITAFRGADGVQHSWEWEPELHAQLDRRVDVRVRRAGGLPGGTGSSSVSSSRQGGAGRTSRLPSSGAREKRDKGGVLLSVGAGQLHHETLMNLWRSSSDAKSPGKGLRDFLQAKVKEGRTAKLPIKTTFIGQGLGGSLATLAALYFLLETASASSSSTNKKQKPQRQSERTERMLAASSSFSSSSWTSWGGRRKGAEGSSAWHRDSRGSGSGSGGQSGYVPCRGFPRGEDHRCSFRAGSGGAASRGVVGSREGQRFLGINVWWHCDEQ
uniref:Uncharacterized protein n=1 Tax=Chromera velia CCMP2878 TaxID=1169474 RepID=A0A0G4GXV3_9ALVE|eukprot:Cvel_791.t1-p1 / transcript=Cvel_791.t1 / gene=Cvel_791 / organism=Chromera_velia_CCMP2878 / gene_product=hypothetical protein / transcript_product=hypothetical protein / location=Cvel_scaffold24:153611-157398(-) / protein_length=682 / sequence_SO=supercontig / SO=protein_coding / is_pseudo=false